MAQHNDAGRGAQSSDERALAAARLDAELAAAWADIAPRLRRLLEQGHGELNVLVHEWRVAQIDTVDKYKRPRS